MNAKFCSMCGEKIAQMSNAAGRVILRSKMLMCERPNQIQRSQREFAPFAGRKIRPMPRFVVAVRLICRRRKVRHMLYVGA